MKSDFLSYVPSKLVRLLDILSKEQIHATVVGGTVRDFFLGLECKEDFDIEVRGDIEIIKKLFPDYEELKYQVLRVKFEDSEFEFSLPREESFGSEFKHDNFTVKFDANLPFSVAAKRRDFTINAIGMEYQDSSFVLNDPYNGVGDIQNKVLRPCGDNFAKDPVRFLRGLRFEILLSFKLEIDQFKTIDHSFYFRQEAQKSQQPLRFVCQYWLKLNHSNHLTELVDKGLEVEKIEEISELVFLHPQDRLQFQKLMEIKFNKGEIELPFLKASLSSQKQLEDKKTLSNLENLLKLNPKWVRFLSEHNYIDLTVDEQQHFLTQEIVYAGISPNQRRVFKWAKLLNLMEK